MKKLFLSLVVLMIAGLQTVSAQGFRVYKSDGTVAQFSLRTDSIVFYDGIGSDSDFGPFTPVNSLIEGKWYKNHNETVTFCVDGTTNYIADGTYKFLPYQGEVLVYDSSKKLKHILRIYDVTAEELVVGTLGSTSFSVWTATRPSQLVTSITLNETSLSLSLNETKDLTATVLPEDADNKEVSWTSSDNAVAIVSKLDGKVEAKGYGTCTITCAAKDGSGLKATCEVTVKQVISGHDYVEIGGLKWATMNVGATTVAGDYTTCCGDYFAWGETEPRYMTIKMQPFDRYRQAWFTWKNGYGSGYDEPYPDYIGGTLDAEHDAATANWGGSWRTPMNDEFKALLKACTGNEAWSQETQELINTITTGGIYSLSETQTIEPDYTGTAGLLFVSASDISKRVFFPLCGRVFGTDLDFCGVSSLYWSSSLYTSDTNNAYYLYINGSAVNLSKYNVRYGGFLVRPVSD